MINKTESGSFFGEDLHLNEEGQALCAEALYLDCMADLPAGVSDHIEDCMVCKAAVLELYDILKLTSPELPAGTHPFFKQNPKPVFPLTISGRTKDSGYSRFLLLLKVAAVLAVIVALGFILFHFRSSTAPDLVTDQCRKDSGDVRNLKNNINPFRAYDSVACRPGAVEKKMMTEQERGNRPGKKEIPKDTALQPWAEQDLLAADFKVNETLESLVGAAFRSEEVRVVSPGHDSRYSGGQGILFRWAGDSLGGYTLKIMDNRAVTLLKREVRGLEYRYVCILKPGIYYWMLATERDIAYVGRFYVTTLKDERTLSR